jgi:hypothetical protein
MNALGFSGALIPLKYSPGACARSGIDRLVMAVTAIQAASRHVVPIIHAPELPATQREKAMTTRSTSKAYTLGAVALALAAAVLPARAQEVRTGKLMICDTQKQVERFVALFNGDAQTAVSAVNAEERNPSACAVADVAYLAGPQIGMARTRNDAFQILPVIVLGLSTPAGLRSIAPAPFYALVKVTEYAV